MLRLHHVLSSGRRRGPCAGRETEPNAALQQVADVKSQARDRRRPIRPLRENEKGRAKRLAQDLEAVWHAETTTNQDRKKLPRAEIEEVQLRSEEHHYSVKILWKGGAVTKRTVRRRRLRDAGKQAKLDFEGLIRLCPRPLSSKRRGEKEGNCLQPTLKCC